MKNKLSVGGEFIFEHVRNGKVIDTWKESNIVVDEGLDHLLETTLFNQAQNSAWYIGIFSDNYTPLATDTALNIAANAGESVLYDEATRPAWANAGVSAQEITNSASKAVFTINDTVTMFGAFLISDSGKSGTVGALFAASKFTASRSLVDTDQLLVTYTVQAASS